MIRNDVLMAQTILVQKALTMYVHRAIRVSNLSQVGLVSAVCWFGRLGPLCEEIDECSRSLDNCAAEAV